MDADRHHPSRRTRGVALVALALALAAAGTACGPGDPPAGFFFFALDEGTPVDFELTALEHAPETSLSVKIGDALLSAPGQAGRIGVALEPLHTHPEWLASIPGGSDPSEFAFSLSFRLTAGGDAPYTPSDTYAVEFVLVDDGGGDAEESEIFLGSTRVGGGQLAAQYDFDTPIPLFYDQCVGGEGDDCLGGVVLYSSPNPGFAPRE